MTVQINSSLADTDLQNKFKEGLEATSAALRGAHNSISNIEYELKGRPGLKRLAAAWNEIQKKYAGIHAKPGDSATTLNTALGQLNDEILPIIIEEHFNKSVKQERLRHFKESVQSFEDDVSNVLKDFSEVGQEVSKLRPELERFVVSETKLIKTLELSIVRLKDKRQNERRTLDRNERGDASLRDLLRREEEELDELERTADSDPHAKEEIERLKRFIQEEKDSIAEIDGENERSSAAIKAINNVIRAFVDQVEDAKQNIAAAQAILEQILDGINRPLGKFIQGVPLVQMWKDLNYDIDTIKKYINDNYSNMPEVIRTYSLTGGLYFIVRNALDDFVSVAGRP